MKHTKRNTNESEDKQLVKNKIATHDQAVEDWFNKLDEDAPKHDPKKSFQQKLADKLNKK